MNPGGAQRALIDGRFEPLRQLGGGGMGVVWRAYDTALDREVALKEVRPADPATATADPEGARTLRERVLREARALARLQHPNVVTIHHIIDSAEYPHPYLVMELVPGGSLADRLAAGPLSVPEAARIGRGVLAALRAAHTQGIQHRDVKPANILLRADGSPVLTDFGIATLHDATALTTAGSLIGSPEYMAPERIRGHEGGPASDLWSLAMTLYVALEGHHPLRRTTALATLAAILDEPLPPPTRCGPLAPLLTAMLARDPAQRPDADTVDRALAAAEHARSPYDSPPPYPTSPVDTGPRSTTTGVTAPTGRPTALIPGPADASPMDRFSGRRRTIRALMVVPLLAAVVIGWNFLQNTHQPGNRSSGGLPTLATSPALGGEPSTGTTTGATPGTTDNAPAAADDDLLTPAGVRSVIKALRPYMPGTKVSQLVVYPGYANAEAPTKADQGLYNSLFYRAGSVTSMAGGTYLSDTTLVDLDAYHWNVLPALLKTAQQTLRVPHPTIRYLIVSAGFFDKAPTIRVYLADAYGGGYLEASATGVVQHTYPRGG